MGAHAAKSSVWVEARARAPSLFFRRFVLADAAGISKGEDKGRISKGTIREGYGEDKGRIRGGYGEERRRIRGG